MLSKLRKDPTKLTSAGPSPWVLYCMLFYSLRVFVVDLLLPQGNSKPAEELTQDEKRERRRLLKDEKKRLK